MAQTHSDLKPAFVSNVFIAQTIGDDEGVIDTDALLDAVVLGVMLGCGDTEEEGDTMFYGDNYVDVMDDTLSDI